MKTLDYPSTGDFVQPRTHVNVKRGHGRDLILANTYEDVRDAWDAGDVFEAHEVLGMKPVPVAIDPRDISSVRHYRYQSA